MRWRWQEILLPLPPGVSSEATVQDAISLLSREESHTAFVYEQGELVGYLALNDLMKQVQGAGSLNQPVRYEKDLLLVRENGWVEFCHNCSIVAGVNEQREPVGYITMEDAKNQLAHLQLESLNHSLNSAEIGIITTNQQFEVNFMNETAGQILGLPRSILAGRNYRKMMAAEVEMANILAGEKKFGVDSTFNFKKITGHFSPVYHEGQIEGIVHVFYLQEHLEKAVSRLEFVRELTEELQTIYAASNEQIMVVQPSGEITNITGSFLKNFWKPYKKEDLIGQSVFELEADGLFEPNIFAQCLKEQQRISMTQSSRGEAKVLSTAVPIMKKDRLEKVIVLSRDVSIEEMSERRNAEGGNPLTPDLTKKLVYRSREMAELVKQLKEVAETESTVLITGESGAGKEVIASHIHAYSRRSDAPFVTINCGAIPENLLESELFGHEKGAFTSAIERKKGLFEAADGGTIFLDEISEIPLHMQVKLLRVLQEREIVRVGGLAPIKVNVRVLAATNRSLRKMVAAQTFREDLFYRLHVVPLQIPPLRKRKEDIAPLALSFLEKLNETYKREKKLSREGLQLLESYQWPGNIRELQNVMERLVVIGKQEVISGDDVFRAVWDSESDEKAHLTVRGIMPLKEAVQEVEDQLIRLALGKYKTAIKASAALGVSASTVSRRMKKVSK
ncbi:sigma 54-interacting transcriptional regulator [Pseudobacillus badius]|uniref:sigma 54-interacting transcriptional regulator n=1 Tax=Bacillus badius TaxID=1455 RepID=UPI002E1DDB04|nr:sigma 54-interacting transcriptional regulator [Bacillus badius]MED0665481.1 sigma 54-interacting transcriptional regulator [Bacillus badius]